MSTDNSAPENAFLLDCVTDIVSSYVANHDIAREDLPDLMREVHAALLALDGSAGGNNQTPAVPIEESITDEYLICLEDGAQLKMLKRYLRTHYQMTPEEYRTKWGLPADYPMTAPGYAKKRSNFAKQIGLGKKK